MRTGSCPTTARIGPSRPVAALLGLALLAAWLALSVTPTSASSDRPVVSGNTPANLRSLPSGAIVGSAEPGVPLSVLDADCDAAGEPWLRVENPGGSGWIWAELLRFQNGFAVEVIIGPLRMRDAPWGLPKGSLAKGEWARVVGVACDGDGAAWYRLRSGEWVFASYLRPEEAAQPVAAGGVAWATVEASEGVLMRAAPWGTPVDSIRAGRSLIVLNSQVDGNGDWWHETLYGHKRGWMLGEYLRLGPLDSGHWRTLVARLQQGSYAVLYAFEGDRLARLMTARSGGSWEPTPRGEFRALAHLGTIHTTIFRWRVGHEWFLPHFIQFQDDYGIHGPMVHEYTRQPSMAPTSGCLMPNGADAAWLYDWLQPEDPIVIR